MDFQQSLFGYPPCASWQWGFFLHKTFQPLFSLTTVLPSRIRLPSRFEAHLDRRIGRLWDSYEDFTAAMPGISDVFGRVFCGLLRQSRIMAEEGVRIVESFFQTRTNFKVVG